MLQNIDYTEYLDFEFFLHFDSIFILPKKFIENGSVFDPFSITETEKNIYQNIKYIITIDNQNYSISFDFNNLKYFDSSKNLLKIRFLEQEVNNYTFENFNTLKIKAEFGSETDPNYQKIEKIFNLDEVKEIYNKYFSSGFNNKRIFLWFDKLIFDNLYSDEEFYPIAINGSAEDLQNIYAKINNYYNYIINYIRPEKCLNLTFFNFKFIETLFNKFQFKNSNTLLVYKYYKQSDKDLISEVDPIKTQKPLKLINYIKNYYNNQKDYFNNLDYQKSEIKKLDLVDNNPRIILMHIQKLKKSIIEDKFLNNFLFQQRWFEFY